MDGHYMGQFSSVACISDSEIILLFVPEDIVSTPIRF